MNSPSFPSCKLYFSDWKELDSQVLWKAFLSYNQRVYLSYCQNNLFLLWCERYSMNNYDYCGENIVAWVLRRRSIYMVVFLTFSSPMELHTELFSQHLLWFSIEVRHVLFSLSYLLPTQTSIFSVFVFTHENQINYRNQSTPWRLWCSCCNLLPATNKKEIKNTNFTIISVSITLGKEQRKNQSRKIFTRTNKFFLPLPLPPIKLDFHSFLILFNKEVKKKMRLICFFFFKRKLKAERFNYQRKTYSLWISIRNS